MSASRKEAIAAFTVFMACIVAAIVTVTLAFIDAATPSLIVETGSITTATTKTFAWLALGLFVIALVWGKSFQKRVKE